MFFGVLIFFKEPRRTGEAETTSVAQAARNFLTVLGNGKFVLFLLIFSGYWIAYWQEFIILPSYIAKYVDPKADTELMLITGPIVVICFTILFNVMMQRMAAFRAVVLGAFISGAAWLLLAAHPSVPMAIVTLIAVAIGEITQSPRYYDYISRLAPSGQQGTYMGFAFLPIGIGSLIGGRFGGALMHHYGEVTHQPTRIWLVVAGVGVATAVLLLIYDKVVLGDTHTAENVAR
jgi:dipeptide/tripeptide permease